MNMEREGKIFDIVLLIIIGAFIVFSFDFNATARVFPFWFGLIAFLFVLGNVIVGSMKNPPKFLSFIKQKGTLADMSDPTEAPEEEEEEVTWKQVVKVLFWLIGYIIALAFVHYLVATFFFLFLLLLIGGKVPWLKSSLISVGFTGFLYFLFEVVL